MKTQSRVDPLSPAEKNLVIGIFCCFLFIIVAAVLPDSLYTWMADLLNGFRPPTGP